MSVFNADNAALFGRTELIGAGGTMGVSQTGDTLLGLGVALTETGVHTVVSRATTRLAFTTTTLTIVSGLTVGVVFTDHTTQCLEIAEGTGNICTIAIIFAGR